MQCAHGGAEEGLRRKAHPWRGSRCTARAHITCRRGRTLADVALRYGGRRRARHSSVLVRAERAAVYFCFEPLCFAAAHALGPGPAGSCSAPSVSVSVETRRSDDLYTGASPDGDGVEAERWPLLGGDGGRKEMGRGRLEVLVDNAWRMTYVGGHSICRMAVLHHGEPICRFLHGTLYAIRLVRVSTWHLGSTPAAHLAHVAALWLVRAVVHLTLHTCHITHQLRPLRRL